jgi:hypothetical protein
LSKERQIQIQELERKRIGNDDFKTNIRSKTTKTLTMSATNIDAQLEVFPETVIEFLLPINDQQPSGTTEDGVSSAAASSSPKATMTLKHPDPKSPPIAFKVNK